MKIYIDNLNLTIIKEVLANIQPYHVSTENNINIFTNEGIFSIEQNVLYKLDPVDIAIKIHKNYFEDFTLIVDESYFNKIKTTSIYGIKHLHKNITKYIHKLNKHSKLKLVIEMIDMDLVNDIYFELDTPCDINELFIKHEIIEFLLLLN